MASRKKAGKSVAPASEPPEETPAIDLANLRFPIVGVGASSGGLDAFVDLLRALPDEPGMAFVLIQHQDPTHASLLSDILRRATNMPLAEVTDDVTVKPNHVYVAPPNAQVRMDDGTLRLTPHATERALPIDRFFDSLAMASGRRAIAVVLSGTQSDGTLGATAIHDAGGVTFAQDQSAKFSEMPKNAAAAGIIDFVLPPSGIAAELTRIGEASRAEHLDDKLPERVLKEIFTVLRRHHDIDFAQYKPTTIERRIRRRVAERKLHSLAEYRDLLKREPREVEHLYADLLIHVTSFFRDPKVFEILEKKIGPELLSTRRDERHPLRIWVPGCATGEEVYSVAMALFDAAERSSDSCPFQIFGTDVSEASIQTARQGIYGAEALNDVPPEKRSRYFAAVRDAFRIDKSVRECCVFARQDVTRDPPFSNLDLISCRNVMIYLGGSLQRKVLSMFHYALRPNGYLMLGSAESIGDFEDVFCVVDRRNKLYQKKADSRRLEVEFEAAERRPEPPPRMKTPREQEPAPHVDLFREADRVVLSRHAPAGVVIDENMEIVQFRGRTSAFLEPAPGLATFNLLKMLREGLLGEVRTALMAARKTERAVRREGIRFRKNGETSVVDLEVLPFVTAPNVRHFVVLFDEKAVAEPAKKGKRGKSPGKADPQQVLRLRRELDATREYLQSIIEEQEAMNEELRSSNEEIQSSNEELQSTNEELQTAKEELQSTNEELTTLNEELENRNSLLAEVNNDLVNVLSSIEVPVVMVDRNQKIRRFNPAAERSLKLMTGDLGRSINDLKWSSNVEDLDGAIAHVVKTLETHEVHVNDVNGVRHLLRIRPYKTVDDKIDGAVLALFTI